jgi:hypothetical protein
VIAYIGIQTKLNRIYTALLNLFGSIFYYVSSHIFANGEPTLNSKFLLYWLNYWWNSDESNINKDEILIHIMNMFYLFFLRNLCLKSQESWHDNQEFEFFIGEKKIKKFINRFFLSKWNSFLNLYFSNNLLG